MGQHWPNGQKAVGPTSDRRMCRRWANVGPMVECYLGNSARRNIQCCVIKYPTDNYANGDVDTLVEAERNSLPSYVPVDPRHLAKLPYMEDITKGMKIEQEMGESVTTLGRFRRLIKELKPTRKSKSSEVKSRGYSCNQFFGCILNRRKSKTKASDVTSSQCLQQLVKPADSDQDVPHKEENMMDGVLLDEYTGITDDMGVDLDLLFLEEECSRLRDILVDDCLAYDRSSA